MGEFSYTKCHQSQLSHAAQTRVGPGLLSAVTSESQVQLRTVLSPQHDLKRHLNLRPGTFVLPLVLTQAAHISTDSICIRITHTDMPSSGNMGPDVIMASDGSTGHSDQYVPWQQHRRHTFT